MISALLLAVSLSASSSVQAAPTLNDRLEEVRSQRLAIEKALVDAEKTKKSTQAQLKRLRSLQKLQHQEKQLTEKRLSALENYLTELQTRKTEVQARLARTQESLRAKFSKLIHPVLAQHEQLLRGDENEGERIARERIISSVALSDLKELEGLRADLDDVDDVETRIEQERQQISSLMQDISEQESLIQFHRKIREDLTRQTHEEHLHQLEEYRKLKVSEVEIEKMIQQFQQHRKLEHEEDQKKAMAGLSLRPKTLPWPLKGKLVQAYGQHHDERTGLNLFNRGIEILTVTDQAPVTCAMDGKVQYAGEIPGKGKVMIVEHPHSVYTIYGGFRAMDHVAGDEVKASEKLGSVASQTPLYFEIRVGNVAIDPVKWLQ